MAPGGMSAEPATFNGVDLALTASESVEAGRWFEALSDRGTVRMPLGKAFFSPSFGMLNDRFGVPWMVVVNPE